VDCLQLDIPASSIRLCYQQDPRNIKDRHTTRLATLITVGFAEELLVLARLIISRQFNSPPRSGVKADGKLLHIIPYSSGTYPIIASLSNDVSIQAQDDGLTLSTIKFTGLAYFQTVFAEETIIDLDYRFRVQLKCGRGWGGGGLLDLSVAMVLVVSVVYRYDSGLVIGVVVIDGGRPV
jgi:hypothetical protein